MLDRVTKVLDEIWSAEWFANVGVPTSLTIVAILFTWRLVVQQLSHDRKLAAAEREESQNRRRAELADEIATQFEDAIERIGTWPDAITSPEWWDQDEWPDYALLRRRSDALFRLSLSTFSEPDESVQWEDVEANNLTLSGRLLAMNVEWQTLVEIQKDEVRYMPETIAREQWRSGVRDLRADCIRRRAAPLQEFAHDLRGWRGNVPVHYRMLPATNRATMYREACQTAQARSCSTMSEWRSAVIRYVDRDVHEDQAWESYSRTVELRVPDFLWPNGDDTKAS